MDHHDSDAGMKLCLLTMLNGDAASICDVFGGGNGRVDEVGDGSLSSTLQKSLKQDKNRIHLNYKYLLFITYFQFKMYADKNLVLILKFFCYLKNAVICLKIVRL